MQSSLSDPVPLESLREAEQMKAAMAEAASGKLPRLRIVSPSASA